MGCVSSKQGSADISHGRSGASSSRPLGRALSRQDYYNRHRGNHNTASDPAEPRPPPKPEDAKSDEEKQALRVASVDFNVAANAAAHHTSAYELTEERVENGNKIIPQLVVRRGQPFDIVIKFDRAYDKEKDDLRIVFDCGKRPKESKGTRVVLLLSDEDKPKEWGAKVVKLSEETLIVRIFTPPSCIVAKWSFKFDTVYKKGDQLNVFRYTHDHPVYIIFNPWCPDDHVYMDDEVSRQEYVLNDRGHVYRGTTKQIHAKPWNFGQFEDFVLDCALYLLDQSELSPRVRGDPVHVSRKISAITNSPDDGGVLAGNWSGNYTGGTSPLAWVGSVAILEEFWKTLRPVKFGQCWVFSGVVTTICRAVGIPARSVTNFASAHDTDGSITIDCHWNVNGEPLEEYNEDSVWNFHVWNDVWMARPDLPAGFGGWQAIDATPQETSDGVYCAGPAPLEALKNGLVHLPYDGHFIFAEVNADRVHWIQKPDGAGWTNSLQKNSIGKFLSTKGPGEGRMDITYMYKFPEGSQQERTAVWRAAQESTRQGVYEVAIEDMTFDLVEKEEVVVGEPFDVTMKIGNNSKDKRTVKVTLTARVIFYTGVPVKSVKSETFNVDVPAGASGEVKMNVTPEQYLDKLVDMCIIKISCMAQVVETNQFHCESDDFRLSKPDIEIKVPKEVNVGDEYEVELSFTNPLGRALTRCEFAVEGAGLQRQLKMKHASVGPHAEAKASAKLKARRAGERTIIASFDSKELADLSGQATLRVNPAPLPAANAES